MDDVGFELVVNTLGHEDQIGTSADVQEKYRSGALRCPSRVEGVRAPATPALQALIWGMPKASRSEAIGERVKTRGTCFQVIRTSVHSRDHICLFESDQGWLLSGDAYMGGKDRAVRVGYDVHQIIASLWKLAKLHVTAIFTGSGTVRDSGTKPLLEKTACLESVGARVSELHDQEFVHRQTRCRPLGREPPIAYITLGNFSGLQPVRSCLTHPPVGEPPADPRGEHSALQAPTLGLEPCSQIAATRQRLPHVPLLRSEMDMAWAMGLARGCVSWTSYVNPARILLTMW
jgi:glyoxylase-like metal-dependent hydrolase (beta-lactamase superfamily II)